MSNKILIAAEAEGIIIRGLETKLKGVGLETVYSSFKLSDLKDKLVGAALIIMMVEDDVEQHADALVYIKDFCAENDIKTIVVAEKENYQTVVGFIHESYALANYSRPINTEKLLSEVEEYIANTANMSKRKSILIVDDDVAYMSMIMDWLKDKYRVSLANSGMEAITWLAGNHADLILLDYEMPIVTGPQVLQMIKSSPKTADIPVMFLTGKGDKESIMAVLSLKPAGYLLKKVDKNGLHENIEKFFASQKAKA